MTLHWFTAIMLCVPWILWIIALDRRDRDHRQSTFAFNLIGAVSAMAFMMGFLVILHLVFPAR